MKKRLRKKWPYYECNHLEECGICGTCKQNGYECKREECKKYSVSKFRKKCEHLGLKAARHFQFDTPEMRASREKEWQAEAERIFDKLSIY